MYTRLFYVTTCEHCVNLWNVIYSEGIGRMFIPVCLDKYDARSLLQLKIKMVPAIVITNENQSPIIYEGAQQCSQWLNNFIYNRRLTIKQRVEQQRRLIQKQQCVARAQEDGLDEYLAAEFEGISDNYSYNNTELFQPKNFVTIGNEEDQRIVTPQIKEKAIDKTTMMNQLHELEKNRNIDNQKFMQTMERNQIQAVFDNNYN